MRNSAPLAAQSLEGAHGTSCIMNRRLYSPIKGGIMSQSQLEECVGWASLSIHLFGCLSIYLSVCLSVCLSIYLFICLSSSKKNKVSTTYFTWRAVTCTHCHYLSLPVSKTSGCSTSCFLRLAVSRSNSSYVIYDVTENMTLSNLSRNDTYTLKTWLDFPREHKLSLSRTGWRHVPLII